MTISAANNNRIVLGEKAEILFKRMMIDTSNDTFVNKHLEIKVNNDFASRDPILRIEEFLVPEPNDATNGLK